MTAPSDSDALVRKHLAQARTIAVIGLSRTPDRASYQVAAYLKQQGYRIIPVNPAGGEILGEKVARGLAEIPSGVTVDIVDVFRPSEATPGVVTEAIPLRPGLIWLQEGIFSEEAQRLAGAAGIPIIMDACILKEHRRLAEEGAFKGLSGRGERR